MQYKVESRQPAGVRIIVQDTYLKLLESNNRRNLSLKKRHDCKVTAYICENYLCDQPVTTIQGLKKVVGGSSISGGD